jgi:chromosome segregation ATPase
MHFGIRFALQLGLLLRFSFDPQQCRSCIVVQAATKLKRIEELEQSIKHLMGDETQAKPVAGSESQALRELENRLDKAVIKTQEAQFIGKTYKQIIERLQQDRLAFDGRIGALEQTIAQRRQEIARLEVRTQAKLQ